MLTTSDVVGFSLLGTVYVVGLIFALVTAPKKEGFGSKVLFKVLIPIFWPFALFYAFCTQPRPEYE